jgi:CRP/FNR family nitrogen fixation transcriptional regulator
LDNALSFTRSTIETGHLAVEALQQRSGFERAGTLGLADPHRAPVFVARDSWIYAEGDLATTVFEVVCGAVRSCRFLSDGRRQIDAFYLPGEFFGFEASGRHCFSAEAVIETRIVVHWQARTTGLEGMGDEMPRDVLHWSMRDLQRTRQHMLLLNRRTAAEKIALFLLDLADRQCSGRSIDLPMTRHDVSDYLSMTPETVSRMLTNFEGSGWIKVDGRNIRFVNFPVLKKLAHG